MEASRPPAMEPHYRQAVLSAAEHWLDGVREGRMGPCCCGVHYVGALLSADIGILVGWCEI